MWGHRRWDRKFFENFHLGSRRLQFQYSNPWGLLVGGSSISKNFGGLTALQGGLPPPSFVSTAAPAAKNFKKSDTFMNMRCLWDAVRTFYRNEWRSSIEKTAQVEAEKKFRE